MVLRIDILCPHEKCWKCVRISKLIDQLLKEYQLNATIQYINDVDTMTTYPTWVLPGLFINDITIARGYVPDKRYVAKMIRELVTEQTKPEK